MKNRIEAQVEVFKKSKGPEVWFFRKLSQQPKEVARYKMIYEVVAFGATIHGRLNDEEKKTIDRAFRKWRETDILLRAAILFRLYELMQLDKVDQFLAATFPKRL